MIRVGVTGHTGFVGKRYMQMKESLMQLNPIDLRNTPIKDIDLTQTDVIVHLAGKAHEMKPIPDEVYFKVNYELSRNLADHAKNSGVKQFIYISSIKVYGDDVDGILDENSVCRPSDPYGESKRMAEEYLLSVNSDNFKVAIVRPPLVYGPYVKGNMIRLLELANRSMPLPLGKIGNKRSMVFVDNLVAMINQIIAKNASGIFIAGDAKPVATDELVSMMRKYLGNRAGLISIPQVFRRLIRKLKPGLYLRLFGSFVVDNSNTNRKLNFVPPFSTEAGIEETVKWFSTKEN